MRLLKSENRWCVARRWSPLGWSGNCSYMKMDSLKPDNTSDGAKCFISVCFQCKTQIWTTDHEKTRKKCTCEKNGNIGFNIMFNCWKLLRSYLGLRRLQHRGVQRVKSVEEDITHGQGRHPFTVQLVHINTSLQQQAYHIMVVVYLAETKKSSQGHFESYADKYHQSYREQRSEWGEGMRSGNILPKSVYQLILKLLFYFSKKQKVA